MLAISVIGAITAYKLYNKEHFSIEKAKPVAELSATSLHQTFVQDSLNAKNKFVGDEINQKVIKVDGEVAQVAKDQQGSTVVLLKTSNEGAFINCTLEAKAGNITIGNAITIKGMCTGYNYDTDMSIPGDVILTRCLIAKN
ncbi:MAG: hypothetical protein IPP48_05825 [Chitinophagaceae bacterium]|nr:hypothetical protein [Chitinophagaceae bacterium]